MKLHPLIRKAIVAVAIVVLFGVFAAPQVSDQVAMAKGTGLARLTIENASQFEFVLMLYGPEDLNYTVPAHSSEGDTILRGTYSFFMRACNHTSTGTMDLSIHKTLYVPVCGGNAGAKGDKHHAEDVSDYIKMVKVKVRNQTQEPIGLYLRTLDNHYFLNLEPKEIQFVTVPKDRYVYSYVACGELVAGYYESLVRWPLDLKCKGD